MCNSAQPVVSTSFIQEYSNVWNNAPHTPDILNQIGDQHSESKCKIKQECMLLCVSSAFRHAPTRIDSDIDYQCQLLRVCIDCDVSRWRTVEEKCAVGAAFQSGKSQKATLISVVINVRCNKLHVLPSDSLTNTLISVDTTSRARPKSHSKFSIFITYSDTN